MVDEIKAKVEVELPREPLSSPLIPNSLRKRWLYARFFFRIFRSLVRKTRNIGRIIKVFRTLEARNRFAHSTGLFSKLVEVDKRFFRHLFAAGAPSLASRTIVDQEISRVLYPEKQAGLRTLMLGVTKKCPLSCEHCYEADLLQNHEVLSREDLLKIILQYQEAGTPVIWFGGGEPMARFRGLRYLLQNASPGTDFWMVTSGFRVNAQTAQALKDDGLTGVIVSLDHHDAAAHNRFRGSDWAFHWAIQACIRAKDAGLVTALSLCVTRGFVSKNNFRKYMDLARHLGVAFVQLLEPKAAGRYAGKDVALSQKQMALLEHLALEYNTDSAFSSYPIVEYTDFISRRVGCNAAGSRYLYINSDGVAQICPFCHKEIGKALEFSPEDTIRLAGQMQCPEFESAKI